MVAGNTPTSMNTDTDDSDVSDVEVEGYADFTRSQPEISLRLKDTEDDRVIYLYNNTNKVMMITFYIDLSRSIP